MPMDLEMTSTLSGRSSCFKAFLMTASARIDLEMLPSSRRRIRARGDCCCFFFCSAAKGEALKTGLTGPLYVVVVSVVLLEPSPFPSATNDDDGCGCGCGEDVRGPIQCFALYGAGFRTLEEEMDSSSSLLLLLLLFFLLLLMALDRGSAA